MTAGESPKDQFREMERRFASQFVPEIFHAQFGKEAKP